MTEYAFKLTEVSGSPPVPHVARVLPFQRSPRYTVVMHRIKKLLQAALTVRTPHKLAR